MNNNTPNNGSPRRMTISELLGKSSTVCPVCGSNQDDIMDAVKAGCAHCYTTFASVLAPQIERLHAAQLPEPSEQERLLLHDYPTYGDIAVSSRIRLARNFAELPFPGAMSAAQAQRAFDQVSEYLGGSSGMFHIVDIGVAKQTAGHMAASLLERHLISKELYHKEAFAGAAISSDETASVMINEEDHLRIQALGEGLSLGSCLETVERLETLLSSHFNFAYDEELGWLTRCPTNLGTGLRASVMLHLPAHTDSGNIHRLTARLARSGYTIRGYYGEGTKPIGRLYQISNQVTMGLSIRDIVTKLNALVLGIINDEHNIQRALDSNHPGFIEDRVWRAYGLLSNARKLDSDEAMTLLSLVRVGVSIGQYNIPTHNIDNLIHRIQPNTLCFEAGRELNELEMQQYRADIIRQEIQIER
ncbi:MAG: ATP--guanido phosphotransferase [Oscillospiraceae bacterium]|jgi:protein arginine kinase|nr:ATP--guanido phosphotransferase [Oscillospiraceae bacterium]